MLNHPAVTYRLRYYGFCTVVALAFMLIGQHSDEVDGWAQVYMPLVGVTMLVISLAGVECQIFLQRTADERRQQLASREEAELQALERQRSFNHLWQDLADCRGTSAIPGNALQELAGLFSADLVAVWAGDKAGGFHLCGAHPVANDGAVRLDRVAQMSPCFDRLRERQQLISVSDFERDTTKAFSWFCEEQAFRHAVLCPVLVRRDLVGVLVFFYRQKPEITHRLAGEMQSAANLLLCAL